MKMKKALALLLCAVLLVAGSVLGTLAYLSSTTEVVENTFTVGDVVIWLDEKDVDNSEDGGDELLFEGRDLANHYAEEGEIDLKLLPGRELTKDPTVWVKSDSEAAYIRMIVTVGAYDKLVEALAYNEDLYMAGEMVILDKLVDANYDEWQFHEFVKVDAETATYEFRYYPTNGIYTATEEDKDGVQGADGNYYEKLGALFTTISIPEDIDNEDLAKLGNVTIDVIAHAIQAEGFNGDAAAAWDAFGA